VGVRVNGDRSVDDASLAREWAVAGAGLVLKSEIDQRRDLVSGALVPLLTDWETEPYPLHAVLPSGRFIPSRVRALVDFLAAKFSAAQAPVASVL
jgi:DNA-binding transcriptional LysR family regulator